MVIIPKSLNTVDVSIIDTGCRIGGIPAAIFTNPQIPGFTTFEGISYVFLVSHTDSEGKVRRVLFDLGTRKDWENMSPHVVQGTKAVEGAILEPVENVVDILERGGIDKKSIEAFIWSHAHVDHVGDPSTFPPSASLIVGPGIKDEYFPGYPTKPDAPVLESDFANREVRQLDYSGTHLSIGGLPALDYFGDGSFYLLDAPGHALGHVVGLARTTPDTFMLFTGDVYHHAGQVRPTANAPLPDQIHVPNLIPNPLPAKLVAKMSPARCCSAPILQPGNVSSDMNAALHTIDAIRGFDDDENVFLVAAHDRTVSGVVQTFPLLANQWKEKNWKERTKWLFLQDFQKALDIVVSAISRGQM
ncbi:uncharacterized protein N0V89_008109 [Didymosphaeria variabile]|uniref:Metallo-beta-lactamase domain-containing protein n=1 Tax=Didymosphaeria variabile TaxID=1932322 RepID=A0A9W9C8J5_9PLEO|nr:uncharacterized protein N0V89_008109 [Didymosphaeria variabile]KAJ4349493.1 hypothetical protein N0V89_008109 [Didymosphaeria variabile]